MSEFKQETRHYKSKLIEFQRMYQEERLNNENNLLLLKEFFSR